MANSIINDSWTFTIFKPAAKIRMYLADTLTYNTHMQVLSLHPCM